MEGKRRGLLDHHVQSFPDPILDSQILRCARGDRLDLEFMTVGIAAALEYFEWVAQHLQLDYSLVSLRHSRQNCLSVSRSPGAF